jgi:serine/threonine protein kinase
MNVVYYFGASSPVMSGFPLPDFGSDTDDYVPFLAQVSSNLHALTSDELFELRAVHGLIVGSDPPIRCTGSSTVYCAVSTQDHREWALKITEHKRRVYEERDKRDSLPPDAFLVETISCFELGNKAVLQMELCSGRDIAGFQFDEQDTWQLIHNIGSALAVVHDAGWIHLDVSPVNILRTDDRFKLADFGTLIRIGEFAEGKEGAGPYVSPEALAYPFGRYSVNAPTDIFSFGLVVIEALTARFVPRGGCEGYQRIRRGEIRLGSKAFPSDCSDGMKVLVNSMLAVDPSHRPTARMLVTIAQDRF